MFHKKTSFLSMKMQSFSPLRTFSCTVKIHNSCCNFLSQSYTKTKEKLSLVYGAFKVRAHVIFLGFIFSELMHSC